MRIFTLSACDKYLLSPSYRPGLPQASDSPMLVSIGNPKDLVKMQILIQQS
jgi:hypothetical protein